MTAGAVALGISQLVAGVFGGTSPVIAVGNSAVDLSPLWLKEWAIRTFGENDKNVLVSGILVVIALIAAGLGILSRRRVAFGTTGLYLFGAVGMLSVLTSTDSSPFAIFPPLIGAAAGAMTLSSLFRRLEPPPWAESQRAEALATAEREASGGRTAEGLAAAEREASRGRTAGTLATVEREASSGARTVPGAEDADRGDAPSYVGAGDADSGITHPDATGADSGEGRSDAGAEDADSEGPHSTTGSVDSGQRRTNAGTDEADSRGAYSDAGGADSSRGRTSAGAEGADSGGAHSGVASGGESAGAGRVERPAVMRAGPDLYAFNRRKLLTGVGVGLGVAGVSGVAGQWLSGRNDVSGARTAVAKALPTPATPLPPLPPGVDFKLPNLSPFTTPNHDFYRVDTALVVPSVDPKSWTLKIHGMVDKPIEITFDDLIRRPLMEADVTLTCVSNEVNGPYVGNARWLGVRMADILREAGLQADADMLLSTSTDGWTCGTPIDVVMDGRDALFAIAMNGEVLPVSHGFPVRQVVPGLYGYVSATKWVTDIKVTRYDLDEAYWTPRGWSAKGPIKTGSRIDVPRNKVKPGRNTIAGVAWAQHRGIEKVEVKVDESDWQIARLAEVPGLDTWRQWSLDWDFTPGLHTIRCRATDGTGETQTANGAPPAPDGATGYPTILMEAV
ncbi:hypothetical protein Aph01nite_55870 [Acrocarpospora phusangensis]|uniref:Oxidoreductase molybdopterin-binding domain-containing protein n=1 Tax=Acrocarpospora phusangensis TaxID=1070424 RepID=A0A919QE56_9ACTN|nr:hypothetical protein Aph01nite_55870 [Acrocarpospora phusangensis]